jgi:hypothetical protein
MRYGFIFTIGVALIGAPASRVAAQPPGFPRTAAPTPPYSPYLNLLRPGSSPAINYYGLVRPQFQSQQSMLALQSQIGANSQAIGNLSATGGPLPATGKTVGFMNYGRYFQNFNPAGGGSSGGGFGGSPFGGGSFGSGGLGGRPGGGNPIGNRPTPGGMGAPKR